MVYKIAVLPGDGIGPEIVSEAVKVLQACAQKFGLTFKFREAPVGGAVIEAAGHPLPEETLALCRKSDAVLLGAIGGPQWDHLPVDCPFFTSDPSAEKKGVGVWVGAGLVKKKEHI